MSNDEELRDWRNIGLRRRQESFVRNFVELKEEEHRKNIQYRRRKLEQLFRQETEWETVKMADVLREKQNIFIKSQSEISNDVKTEEQEQNMHRLAQVQSILDRDRCPYYRESLSKEISEAINAHRQQEILLKKSLTPHIH